MHPELLTLPPPKPPEHDAGPTGSAPKDEEDDARLRRMTEAHVDGLWRFLRRLGVAPGDLEDAMQEVVVVAASKLETLPRASERSFLFGTAMRVAGQWRRFRGRRREVELDAVAEPEDAAPQADALLDQARARTLLDEVLDGLPLDVRTVFTLCEIEELTMAEVAVVLELAPGTVASRLRRGRELFEAGVTRLQARMARRASSGRSR